MIDINDIQILQQQPEGQQFDRKSFRIDAKALAVIVVAFANADGGDVVIGIEDDGRITGINSNEDHLNELLRVPFDFCVPSVPAEVHFVDCIDVNGNPNRVSVMHVEPSMRVHANQADDAFYRVGDKSKKLNFEMRMQLFYAKGGRYYEDEPVYGATIDDIDLDYVTQHCKKIGYAKDAETYLRTNKGFIATVNGVDKVSGAAILLFGKDPQKFFQRARIRIVRYLGDEERFGREMNVIKDVSFEGRILEMTQKAIAFVDTQIREYTFLGDDARFVTIPQYPPFCWTELIVNAVAHRDYSILGTDIMVKIFDHHYVVESPGILPGLVRIDNIRQMHFSRNPKIAEFMQQYKLVKEFGEGVDRMFREMAEAGNPAPEYKQVEFMLKVRLNSALREDNESPIPHKTEVESYDHEGNEKVNETERVNERVNERAENGLEPTEKSTEKTSQKNIDQKEGTGKNNSDTVNVGVNAGVNVGVNVGVNERKVIETILRDPLCTAEALTESLNISKRQVERIFAKLKKKGLIRRVGPDKGGHWEVIEQNEKGGE